MSEGPIFDGYMKYFYRAKISLSETPISLWEILNLPIWLEENITCMVYYVPYFLTCWFMCEFWDKWVPAFFLGSFERFSSINLKLIILILIFLGLVTQVFFLALSLVLMAFVQVWFYQGGHNFFFGPDLDFGIVISQIFISWFVKLIDSVEISSCRDNISIFFSHNVLNSPQSALFSFHLDLLDVPMALY